MVGAHKCAVIQGRSRWGGGPGGPWPPPKIFNLILAPPIILSQKNVFQTDKAHSPLQKQYLHTYLLSTLSLNDSFFHSQILVSVSKQAAKAIFLPK